MRKKVISTYSYISLGKEISCFFLIKNVTDNYFPNTGNVKTKSDKKIKASDNAATQVSIVKDSVMCMLLHT